MNKKSIHRFAGTFYSVLVSIWAVFFILTAMIGILIQLFSGVFFMNLLLGILALLALTFMGGIFVVGIVIITILSASFVTQQFILLITKKSSPKEVFLYCLLYYSICFISSAFMFFLDRFF